MKTVRIGIIGVGGIARAHIAGLQQCPDAKITAICDIKPQRLQEVGDRLNIPAERRFLRYEDLIACPDVDAVQICTPNHLHIPMAVESVRAGKPFELEKPISTSYEAAIPLENALKAHPVPNMMCFSYRFQPAVRYAKKLMEEKVIGDPVSVNVAYLKDSALWEGRRLEWRFIKEYAGTGVLGDLGVHLLDMTEFLTGKVQNVSATCGIVVKKRQKEDSDEWGPVETDDYCNFIAELEGGIPCNFSITRCALGHDNTIRYEIFGTKGVLSLDLNYPNQIGLSVCGAGSGQRKPIEILPVPEEFKVAQERTFLDLLQQKDTPYLPTVEDGLWCQKILDAILLSSQEHRQIDL